MFVIRKNTSLVISKVAQNARYASMEAKNHYDIIIAGGGMVGTTLACTLGRNPKLAKKQILLLEGEKDNTKPLGDKYSNRVSALNPSTQKLLDKIGAWKHISETRCAPVKKLQVWDALSNSMITFNDDCADVVAYIVENDLLLLSVRNQLKKASNVSVVYDAKIKNYNLLHEDAVTTVDLENGNTLSTNLLLGCDGANSKVRQTMGVHYLSWKYDQMGVVATLNLTEDMENVVAWQRFLPTGPIALLPLTNKLSSLVWSTTPQQAKNLLTLTNEQFVDAVNEALWKEYKPDEIVAAATRSVDKLLKSINLPSNAIRQLPPTVSAIEEGSRAAFPLGFGHATNYVAKGVALVGDAAHRIHPLAGQGVNLGFGDVATLDRLIGDAVYSGFKLGSLSSLKEYECDRQRHNVPTMLAVDGLHKLYNTDFTPLVLLRSVGLQFTHALTPLKKAIMGHATA